MVSIIKSKLELKKVNTIVRVYIYISIYILQSISPIYLSWVLQWAMPKMSNCLTHQLHYTREISSNFQIPNLMELSVFCMNKKRCMFSI